MKKIISAVLSALMLVLLCAGLCSCSEKKETAKCEFYAMDAEKVNCGYWITGGKGEIEKARLDKIIEAYNKTENVEKSTEIAEEDAAYMMVIFQNDETEGDFIFKITYIKDRLFNVTVSCREKNYAFNMNSEELYSAMTSVIK